MSNDPPVLAVSAVVVHDGKLLMVPRANTREWALPGGKVEPGESLAGAVRRELREETGLRVRVREVATVVERVLHGVRYVIVVHPADVIGGTLRPGGDATTCEWVPLADVFSRRTVPRLRNVLRAAGALPPTASLREDAPPPRARSASRRSGGGPSPR